MPPFPSPFPAVLIGGPPHSGKSVLVYSLSHALRQAHVPHYVLRACPDGEGDWSQQANQSLVRTIRIKGEFTDAYIARIAHYLANRHLPLLVDVGGRPTETQQALFGFCTHAILLAAANDPAAYAREMAAWQTMLRRQQVTPLAYLESLLPGEDRLDEVGPPLTGAIANLQRGETAVGPVITALVNLLDDLFDYTEAELARIHLAHAPVELALNLSDLARTLGAADGSWQPQMLPALLDYLPAQTPLALYGRSNIWVNAALALLAHPAPIWLYNTRLGWVQPPTLPVTSHAAPQPGWSATLRDQGDFLLLEMTTSGQELDIDEPEGLPLPPIPPGKGLLLSGKMPHWLTTAVARQFAPHAPWIAVYQPQLSGAVVVGSRETAVAIGQLLPFHPTCT